MLLPFNMIARSVIDIGIKPKAPGIYQRRIETVRLHMRKLQ